jgi:hypothetical protein
VIITLTPQDEEDTVDEAPSIIDEAKDNTPTFGSDGSKSSKNWSAAENVVAMVEADIKLKDAQKEGVEVNEVLQEARQEDEKEAPLLEPIAKDIKYKQVQFKPHQSTCMYICTHIESFFANFVMTIVLQIKNFFTVRILIFFENIPICP